MDLGNSYTHSGSEAFTSSNLEASPLDLKVSGRGSENKAKEDVDPPPNLSCHQGMLDFSSSSFAYTEDLHHSFMAQETPIPDQESTLYAHVTPEDTAALMTPVELKSLLTEWSTPHRNGNLAPSLPEYSLSSPPRVEASAIFNHKHEATMGINRFPFSISPLKKPVPAEAVTSTSSRKQLFSDRVTSKKSPSASKKPSGCHNEKSPAALSSGGARYSLRKRTRVSYEDDLGSDQGYDTKSESSYKEESIESLPPKRRRTSPSKNQQQPAGEPQRNLDPVESVVHHCLTEADVLCGRGGATNSHPGNLRYLRARNSMQARYKNTQDKKTKMSISWSLVEKVHCWGGKFLVLDRSRPTDIEEKYLELEVSKARGKAAHALRDENKSGRRHR